MTDDRTNLFETLQKMRLLLVEDDALVRNSLRLFFENEGCRLEVLETAEEAVDAVRRREYDIVITDYRLPGMDGLNFLRELHSCRPRTMRVLLTAYMDEDVLADAFRVGVHEFIEKPFSSRDIEEALSRLIAKRAAAV
ncbi:MAG TPA: response regulator [Desulfurivibrionaceae bacterium]|nr:response regulator [Desulfurivibrionaceae bacterium]